jgi:polysaccharide biosynthesis/export protein
MRWLGFLFLLLVFPVSAVAQSPRSSPDRAPIGSELGRQNMSRVAASSIELKAILLRDPGLMVELKRWVAKDATDHGQIVRDADLTNDAIYDRLENDVEFRAVATVLVQQYGYLVPQINPESELAKEHALLIQERSKWVAQQEEEERAQQRAEERTRKEQQLQRASLCGSDDDTDCAQKLQQQTQTPQGQTPPGRQNRQQGIPPSQNFPNELAPPFIPSPGPATFGGGQLLQTSNEDLTGSSPFGFGGGLDSGGESSSGSYGNIPPALAQQLALGGGGQLGPSFGGAGGLDLQSALLGMSMGDEDQYGQAGSLGGLGRMNAMGPASPELENYGARERTITVRNRPKPAAEPAEMEREPNPYKDIPSLYDMYLQAAPHPREPKRFGIDVFDNGIRDSELVPMDLPAGPDYVLGPGDSLAIDLWGGVSRRLYRTVDREGRVSLPEVGPVLVSGKSLAEVQENVQESLRTQFRDVSADVSLSRLRTIRVYEVGDVTNPGAYDISSLSTPLNALFVSGGPTARGSLRIVKHYRGNQLIQVVDVYDLLLHGVKGNLERLENGDTVLVPPIGPQVTVEGMVRRPAVYELKDEKNLASVLELAGGLLPTAALRHIEVQRTIAHEKQTMLSVDVPESSSPDSEVTKKFESFEIKDGDKIRIFPIAPYNQDAIYLDGHVIRPGRYSYRPGMRLTDVIASYKDLLPEPAAHYAEIIRLNAPDYRPSVESFDLADALSKPAESPVLKPLDTVRIYSRYDFENPPAVSVLGDVRSPGTYRTAGQIRLSDAVHLAGGLAPDAETNDAQVFRYLPDGKTSIFSVNLSGALSADPKDNIVLEPRDRLLIHRNPEAVEPAAVYVEGDVAKPGRYPLTSNMTVADLIRVGGGLKPSADTESADLTHYQWTTGDVLAGRHEAIAISAAQSGDPNANLALHNGDVLTIRELPNWNDLGSSITVKGEVKHPGAYGIRPGERLSSILERAGGFQPGAYPYGAVLERVQVRELESKSRDELILRIKDEENGLELLPENDPKQKEAKEKALEQWRSTLDQLSANTPVGRVNIRISSDIRRWRNSPEDVEVQAGDTLVIPKKPSYVMVTGQVFNPTAVSFRPGKSARWYLGQAGGPTQLANKKEIMVIRADGSVMSSKRGVWDGDSLSGALQPGDAVVVPEKAIAGPIQWQNIFMAGQLASGVATALYIALHY